MAIYSLNGVAPQISESAWVEKSATVIGNVELQNDASVWFGAILRGDSDKIHVGKGSNIQDRSVFHVDKGQPLHIGNFVTIGHGVTLHGCSIGDGSLVGINAVILNGAMIGKNCLIGAGSLVTEGKEFPDGWLVVGSPAKAIRPLTREQIAGLERSARHYMNNAVLFRTSCLGIA
ncbi:gamma carbonic anhydrase family protein [Polaromonas sp. JS666]|uniref:gamma carbonic anhydrase family protein n=1 Tax=Polaromonas sp. (strain JS666 / ATCC BAA-500) TaxID=296591 RepID=UPI0000536BD0|nr:gamma carbonic anhydrase family protein [Polaromonas sp. JS666]ABE42329.1 transferase hexapeptide repeat [Polaromonas sp. JS666]